MFQNVCRVYIPHTHTQIQYYIHTSCICACVSKRAASKSTGFLLKFKVLGPLFSFTKLSEDSFTWLGYFVLHFLALFRFAMPWHVWFYFKVWVQKIRGSSLLRLSFSTSYSKFLESWSWSKYCSIPPPKGQFSSITPWSCYDFRDQISPQVCRAIGGISLGCGTGSTMVMKKFYHVYYWRFFFASQGWEVVASRFFHLNKIQIKRCTKFWSPETWELELFWSFFFWQIWRFWRFETFGAAS